jgi:hypothetical protein
MLADLWHALLARPALAQCDWHGHHRQLRGDLAWRARNEAHPTGEVQDRGQENPQTGSGHHCGCTRPLFSEAHSVLTRRRRERLGRSSTSHYTLRSSAALVSISEKSHCCLELKWVMD